VERASSSSLTVEERIGPSDNGNLNKENLLTQSQTMATVVPKKGLKYSWESFAQ